MIKWQNDAIDKTAVLPMLGITRKAMLAPLKISRQTGEVPIYTNLRSEIANSEHFSAIHLTRATDTEGRWFLVVADESKVKAASKFILQITKSIYTPTQSQIPLEARHEEFNVPEIEDKSKTMALITQPISDQQASAWGPIFSNTDTTKSGSRMRNLPTRKPRQVRKIVELSFDPESTDDFPHLKTSKPVKASNSVTSKYKSTSYSHSSVSGVTKADFATLGDELRALVHDELRSVKSVKSNNTSQTNLTMVTLMSEGMLANRKSDEVKMVMMQQQAAAQTQMTQQMQQQMTLFHPMFTIDKNATNKTQIRS